jgi:hypothetical protein
MEAALQPNRRHKLTPAVIQEIMATMGMEMADKILDPTFRIFQPNDVS